MWDVTWNGEVVDSFDTEEKAKDMAVEYAIAFPPGDVEVVEKDLDD